MFNFPLNAGVPGFRVGLPVDDDPVRRPLPVAPSAAAFGYDPYSNVPQTTAPTAFRPAGMFYNADSGLSPTPHRAYVPVAGGWPSQDPSRQTSDRPADPYTDNGGNPHQTVSAPTPGIAEPIGGLVGGYLGNVLGGETRFPGGGYLGGLAGMALGGVLGRGTDFTARAMIDAAPLGANPVAP